MDKKESDSNLTIEQAKKIFQTAHIRELLGHKKKAISPNPHFQVHSVAWNITGRKLASGSVDKTARIWSVDAHATKDLELVGHTVLEISPKFPQDSVDQLCWDPTHPDRLATASIDRTVKIWDARSSFAFFFTLF